MPVPAPDPFQLITIANAQIDQNFASDRYTTSYWLGLHPEWTPEITQSLKTTVTDTIHTTDFGETNDLALHEREVRDELNNLFDAAYPEFNDRAAGHRNADSLFRRMINNFCPRFPIC